VQSALGGFQTIHELTAPAGRLHESRRVVLESVSRSRHLQLVRPDGAMYAFPAVHCPAEDGFDDHAFAAHLLEQAHILIVPGTSFNISDTRHFRITLLPEPSQLQHAVAAIDALLDDVLAQH
jgi:alanine-synthesizing transaminase